MNDYRRLCKKLSYEYRKLQIKRDSTGYASRKYNKCYNQVLNLLQPRTFDEKVLSYGLF